MTNDTIETFETRCGTELEIDYRGGLWFDSGTLLAAHRLVATHGSTDRVVHLKAEDADGWPGPAILTIQMPDAAEGRRLADAVNEAE